MHKDLLDISRKITSTDGCTKYLLELEDGEIIEAVHIPLDHETKICLSCQVGCVNKCKHCATGRQIEYKRDLTPGEMFSQAVTIADDNDDDLKNYSIVFMGMGEPFFNYDAVIHSLDLFAEIGIEPEKVTLSTSGVVPKIHELSRLSRRPKLAVSVHATTDLLRSQIVQMNKIYGLNDLLATVKKYNETTQDEVLIQYTLIAKFNDSNDQAKQLVEMMKDLICEVQIIPFNSFPGSSLEEPTIERIDYFTAYLNSHGIKAISKRSRGIDICAGCGQLGCN